MSASSSSTPSVHHAPAFRDALRSPRLFTRECLAGTVTALVLIPEVIAFSVIAGVDPKSSLIASIVLCLVMTVLGGRPAMVTAAAGAVALVVAPMVRTHGAEYLLPCIVLAGAIQILFGVAGLARVVRYVPRSVMIGFVNALGILIFLAQTAHLVDKPWPVYLLGAVCLAVLLLLPRLTTAIPASLVAIVAVTALSIAGGLAVPTVSGAGDMSPGLPGFTPLNVPLDLRTLAIIWPTALSIAFVGLLESLLTARLVDQMTDTRSSTRRESWALGVANLCAAGYGGTAGCAMIGQTMVNVGIGGARTRLSTLVAGLVLLLLVTLLSELMGRIPMIALATVMMLVAVRTFDWHSVELATLRRMPLSETAVMATTVVLTIATSNLAVGVAGGVLLAIVLFARRVASVIRAERQVADDGRSVRYEIHGPLFFGSSNDLFERFRYAEDPPDVVVDFSRSQIWDASSVAALDAIATKYRARGAQVRFTGLDARSQRFLERLTGHLR